VRAPEKVDIEGPVARPMRSAGKVGGNFRFEKVKSDVRDGTSETRVPYTGKVAERVARRRRNSMTML